MAGCGVGRGWEAAGGGWQASVPCPGEHGGDGGGAPGGGAAWPPFGGVGWATAVGAAGAGGTGALAAGGRPFWAEEGAGGCTCEATHSSYMHKSTASVATDDDCGANPCGATECDGGNDRSDCVSALASSCAFMSVVLARSSSTGGGTDCAGTAEGLATTWAMTGGAP